MIRAVIKEAAISLKSRYLFRKVRVSLSLFGEGSKCIYRISVFLIKTILKEYLFGTHATALNTLRKKMNAF